MTTEANRMQRGSYLIKGGAVITVDPALGTMPKADILVRDGVIVSVGATLSANDAEVIDASRMIVMPGMIDTHYHMWSTSGETSCLMEVSNIPSKMGDRRESMALKTFTIA